MPASAIVGFGRYLPRLRIRTEDIALYWGHDPRSLAASLGVQEKTVAERDEDSFTMAFEAARQAIENAGIRPSEISAIFVGSESHPYAVKPTSSMLVSALELDPFCHCADLEFACKAGTAGMQIIDAFVCAGKITYGLAIGTDRAQAKPGDALEYTAAAGAVAVVIGSALSRNALCRIDHTISFTTDTPDFWRAAGARFPSHSGRFTGDPAYFRCVREALRGILEVAKMKPDGIAHLVLHMPNAKFPRRIAKEFGFTQEQIDVGFVVTDIGNTYSACSLLGLARVLEQAKSGERILLVSYGSGAGADAFLLTMLRDGSPLSPDQRPPEYISYSEYAKLCA